MFRLASNLLSSGNGTSTADMERYKNQNFLSLLRELMLGNPHAYITLAVLLTLPLLTFSPFFSSFFPQDSSWKEQGATKRHQS